jgi:hypothetical protein
MNLAPLRISSAEFPSSPRRIKPRRYVLSPQVLRCIYCLRIFRSISFHSYTIPRVTADLAGHRFYSLILDTLCLKVRGLLTVTLLCNNLT